MSYRTSFLYSQFWVIHNAQTTKTQATTDTHTQIHTYIYIYKKIHTYIQKDTYIYARTKRDFDFNRLLSRVKKAETLQNNEYLNKRKICFYFLKLTGPLNILETCLIHPFSNSF